MRKKRTLIIVATMLALLCLGARPNRPQRRGYGPIVWGERTGDVLQLYDRWPWDEYPKGIKRGECVEIEVPKLVVKKRKGKKDERANV